MSITHIVRQVCLGALYQGKGICRFTVWAPLLKHVAVNITEPEPLIIPMEQDERGYWRAEAAGLFPGTRYVYRLDDEKERPDPASRFQPEGIHGRSEVIDPASFPWQDDDWRGIPLHDYIIYELHIGTFTPEGTFEAAISRIDYLKELGITAIEIMPVAQFPGHRNWGYDGVYSFAPQNTYGGPPGLKSLVDACHRNGLSVILDVVYNHLGPDGNYLSQFGPYFTNKYRTPWGEAINYDGPYSDEVRNYFIENALYWFSEYHIDALRLDAIDTIFDFSAKHFLAELTEAVRGCANELGRELYIIAESDLNDAKIINPAGIGGYGVDAQWSDDFHHSLHTLITGERNGYYLDFGTIGHLQKAFREGFVYSGCYSPFRKRRHGNSSKDNPADQFVVCSQNHDQIGNRMLGSRLASIVSFDKLKLAAGCVVLSPYIPLLFMGEEYGEKAPFQYFVSHIDEPLIVAVRKGRREEFSHFQWVGDVPDPQDEQTFLRSKINPELRKTGEHKVLFDYYRTLFHLRKTIPALSTLDKENLDVAVCEQERALVVRRGNGNSLVFILYCFNDKQVPVPLTISAGRWIKLMDSSAPEWGGTVEPDDQILQSRGESTVLHMNPYSLVLYELRGEEP